MKKKLLALLLVLALAFTFSACGTGTGDNGESSGSSETPPAEIDNSDLPAWDLTEIFADSAAFKAELKELETKFLPKFQELVKNYDTVEDLVETLKVRDELRDRYYRLALYAMLRTSLDAADAEAKNLAASINDLNSKFKVTDAELDKKTLTKGESFWEKIRADKEAEEAYGMELESLINKKDHKLTAEQEELLQPAYFAKDDILSVEQTLDYVDLKFPEMQDQNGNTVDVNYTVYEAMLDQPDRDLRTEALYKHSTAYKEHENTFAAALNAYYGLASKLARAHGYENTLQSALDDVFLKEDAYYSLLDGAKKGSYLVKREYGLRAKALGLKDFGPQDKLVSLTDYDGGAFSIKDTEDMLCKSLAPLGKDYISVVKRAFDENWIDAALGENKETGAFAEIVPGMHPYILVNFNNTFDSVDDIAHEMGHAVHMVWSADNNTNRYERSVGITASEVASTANELILMNYMIDNAKSDKEKLFYIMREVNIINGTFFRQAQFADFEDRMYKIVEGGGALDAAELNEIYKEIIETYVPGMTYDDLFCIEWARIPHFFYDYYVYSYAMSNAVAANVAEAVKNNDQEFIDKYIDYLKAGTSAKLEDLFKIIDVDINDSSYIQPLMDLYSDLLDQAEELVG